MTKHKIYTIRHLLAKYGRKIARQHLVMGAMGNISVRDKEEVWIKRAGAWLERAKPKDFIKIGIKKGAKKRDLVSKEINLHLGCYRARNDIKAVVHTHPIIATGLSTAGVKFGVKTIRYYKPGSKRLAKEVSNAIKRFNAVLLTSHGLVTVGKSLREAYERTLAIESGAKRIVITALR